MIERNHPDYLDSRFRIEFDFLCSIYRNINEKESIIEDLINLNKKYIHKNYNELSLNVHLH